MGKATEVDAVIGRNLRTLRASRSLNQDHVGAQMAGCGHRTWNRGTVSEVERGRRAVLVSEAVDLAAALGVPVEKLWSGPLL